MRLIKIHINYWKAKFRKTFYKEPLLVIRDIEEILLCIHRNVDDMVFHTVEYQQLRHNFGIWSKINQLKI